MPILHHSRLTASILACMWLQGAPAIAQSAAVLELHSKPSQTEPHHFSLEGLDELHQVEFSTTTLWTDGTVTFSGVPLKALLEEVEFQGQTVELVALNDYSISLPIDEIEDEVPIVATRMDGAPMSVRMKGPFWLVFPYDRHPKYRTDTMYARSIWQLFRIKAVD